MRSRQYEIIKPTKVSAIGFNSRRGSILYEFAGPVLFLIIGDGECLRRDYTT
jgi:hypothetical protein